VNFLKFRPSSGTHRTVDKVNDKVNTEPSDWTGPAQPRPAGRRSGRRLLVAGGAAVALALGGVAVAAAASSDSTPSPRPSAGPSPGTTGAPDRDRRERLPFLAGTVVSASGNTITITDVQGFRRTIHTSSSTTYENGLSARPAAGTRIYALGTVDSDKTSLKATRVGKLPDHGPGRGFPGHGFPGHGFPGAPGRHHDGAPPAPRGSGTPGPGGSGTPSPAPSTPTPSPSTTA
jgi:hypothetical protein